jgi:hypothetical protein
MGRRACVPDRQAFVCVPACACLHSFAVSGAIAHVGARHCGQCMLMCELLQVSRGATCWQARIKYSLNTPQEIQEVRKGINESKGEPLKNTKQSAYNGRLQRPAT